MAQPDAAVTNEITALVARYIDLFNADAFAEAFACYRMPFTWLIGRHATTVLSLDDFVTMMAATKAGLRDAGLGVSRLERVTVRELGPHVALAEVVVRRLRPDGSELAELGGSYMLHRDGHGWRFAIHCAHPVSASLAEQAA